MDWSTAMAWASNLVIEGVDDWRLPVGPIVGAGYNQTASAMGNMFYTVLGGVAGDPITTTHNNPTNYAFFQNVQSNDYWSGVEVDSNDAWVFGFGDGYQLGDVKYVNLFAWAVRSGDVGASPVPVPGALVLMGPALLGLLGVKRSRHRAGAVIG